MEIINNHDNHDTSKLPLNIYIFIYPHEFMIDGNFLSEKQTSILGDLNANGKFNYN